MAVITYSYAMQARQDEDNTTHFLLLRLLLCGPDYHCCSECLMTAAPNIPRSAALVFIVAASTTAAPTAAAQKVPHQLLGDCCSDHRSDYCSSCCSYSC
jgi:hypothetical protein